MLSLQVFDIYTYKPAISAKYPSKQKETAINGGNTICQDICC